MLELILYAIAFTGMSLIMLLAFSIFLIVFSSRADKKHRENFLKSLQEKNEDSL